MIGEENQLFCAGCGYRDFDRYIFFEDEPYCDDCFAEKIYDFAKEFPIQLAAELGLDVLEVPDDDEVIHNG